MKISEVIKSLQEQQSLIGDKEVFITTFVAEEEDVYLKVTAIKHSNICNGVAICGC